MDQHSAAMVLPEMLEEFHDLEHMGLLRRDIGAIFGGAHFNIVEIMKHEATQVLGAARDHNPLIPFMWVQEGKHMRVIAFPEVLRLGAGTDGHANIGLHTCYLWEFRMEGITRRVSYNRTNDV